MAVQPGRTAVSSCLLASAPIMAMTSATVQSPAGAAAIENTAKGARNLRTFFIVLDGVGRVGARRPETAGARHVIDITELLKVLWAT